MLSSPCLAELHGRKDEQGHFSDFFHLLPMKADSERSWTLTREEIEARNYDLSLVNPKATGNEGTLTVQEMLDLMEEKGREVAEALAIIRRGSIESRYSPTNPSHH